MPKVSSQLSEAEIKMAIAYWVDKGCPEVGRGFSVYLSLDRPTNPTPTDAGNGFSANLHFE